MSDKAAEVSQLAVWRLSARHNAPMKKLLLIGLLCIAPLGWAEWFSDTAPIMGTRVHVEISHDDAQQASALIGQVMAEMRRIDRAFSPYREDSELSKVNREASADWMEVSDEMIDLLGRSYRMSLLSDGAFDITYASVGRFYDYRAGTAPDDAALAAAVHAIDYRHIEVDGNRVRFKHPQVYIDLGGIAKGYAVDRGITLLTRAGITQASVSAGGDSRILGDRGGQPWTVGVKHPRNENEMAVLLPLEDVAVSTSGDYERFFERDGVR